MDGGKVDEENDANGFLHGVIPCRNFIYDPLEHIVLETGTSSHDSMKRDAKATAYRLFRPVFSEILHAIHAVFNEGPQVLHAFLNPPVNTGSHLGHHFRRDGLHCRRKQRDKFPGLCYIERKIDKQVEIVGVAACYVLNWQRPVSKTREDKSLILTNGKPNENAVTCTGDDVSGNFDDMHRDPLCSLPPHASSVFVWKRLRG